MRILSLLDQCFHQSIKSSLGKQLREHSEEAVNFTLDKTLWSYVFDHLSTDIETNSYNRDPTILIKGLRKQMTTPDSFK